MAIISGNEFLRGGKAKVVVPANTSTMSVPNKTERKSLWEKYKGVADTMGDFSEGFVKGAIEAPIETAALLQKGGKKIIQAIDPDAEVGFKSLEGEQLEQIRELLKAENTAEKAGKITEFLAELVWPVGKAKEVETVVRKGKELAEVGIDIIGKKGKEVAETIVEKGKEGIEKGIDLTREAAGKIPGMLDDIPKPVETVLRETDTSMFNKYAEAAQKASVSYKNPTPL